MTYKREVLLVGSGGVGTIVGYGINYTNNANLSAVLRRDYEKVNEKGFDITSIDYGDIKGWKPDQIYSSIEKAAESDKVYDFVVVCTKNIPDVTKVEDLVEPVITKGKTGIVLIQNGFDLGRPFFAKYPDNVIISGVSNIGSHNYNGVVHQTQKDDTIISYFESPTLSEDVQYDKCQEFISIYSNPKNSISYHPSAKFMRYKKLVYNACFNTITTLCGTDTGRLEAAGTLDSVVIPAMREVIMVAKADGVELPDDVINVMIHGDDGDYFEPSMLVDFKKGNPLELQTILGNLLVVAKELNVETPILTVVFNLLKAVQFKLLEGQGIISVPKERPIYDRFYK